MKANELKEKYIKVAHSDKAVELLLKDITPDEKIYMSFMEKLTLARKIANASMINQETNMMSLNTPAKFVLTMMSLIYKYTLIEEVSAEGYFSDYDELNSVGLIEMIVEKIIPEHEYTEFNTILQMVCDDIMTNKFETHNFAYELAGMVTNVFVKVLEPIAPALDKIAAMSEEDIDKVVNKLNKTLDRITK